jgi:hypothetical protein
MYAKNRTNVVEVDKFRHGEASVNGTPTRNVKGTECAVACYGYEKSRPPRVEACNFIKL